MNENIKNILSDSSEVLLDTLINNDVLKEIPVIGTSLNIIRAFKGIRDTAYLNKVKTFIEQIGEITEEQKTKLIEESKKDQSRRTKFGDAVFTSIEQSDSLIKVEYIAISFEAFLNGDFDESTLRQICHSIRNTFTDELIEMVETELVSKDLKRWLISTGFAETEYDEDGPGISVGEPTYHLMPIANDLRKAWRKYHKPSETATTHK